MFRRTGQVWSWSDESAAVSGVQELPSSRERQTGGCTRAEKGVRNQLIHHLICNPRRIPLQFLTRDQHRRRHSVLESNNGYWRWW